MVQEACAPRQTRALYNTYEGTPSGRQLSETVPEFLSRLPPLTTQLMTSGPWVFIGNPHTKYRHTNEDIRGFKTKGRELLDEFAANKAEIETSMAGKAKGIITRQITLQRQKLESDIRAAAQEYGCTTGKWMLFPAPDRVNSAWSLVATATANDELGIAAKVATDDGTPDKSRLICIYTEDFQNKADVKRVLAKLYAMGLCGRKGAIGGGQGIFYKADAYSHLDIMGGNEWGLKPSLYSSRDLLAEGTETEKKDVVMKDAWVL